MRCIDIAVWTSVVTQLGLNLQAKLLAGQAVTFTKAVSGSNYVNPDSLIRQTDITSQKQALILSDIVPKEDGKAMIPIMLVNKGLSSGYTLQQIGIFARDPDLGEILYFIAQAEEPDVIPAEAAMPEFEIEFAFTVIYGNASGMSITLDPNALATKADIIQINTALSNKVSNLGIEVINSTSADTVSNWANLNTGYSFYQTNGCLTNQPSTFGFLTSYVSKGKGGAGKDVFQIWNSQGGEGVWYRNGNQNGWTIDWRNLATAADIEGLNTALANKANNKPTARIPQGANLDTYLTLGDYYCLNNEDAATIQNSPYKDGAYRLTVQSTMENVGYYMVQEATSIYLHERKKYRKFDYFYNQKWSDWVEIATATDLENKVNRGSVPITLGTNVLALAPGRYTIDGVTTEAEAMNLPVRAWHYEIDMIASINAEGLNGYYKAITVYPIGYKSNYINKMEFNGTWSGWVEVATAAPPQEFELPLVSGISIYSRADYSKAQDGTVVLNIGILFSEAISIGTRKIIATMPVGFRPANWLRIPAIQANSSAICAIEIGDNGEITLAATQALSANLGIFAATISYVAII